MSIDVRIESGLERTNEREGHIISKELLRTCRDPESIFFDYFEVVDEPVHEPVEG